MGGSDCHGHYERYTEDGRAIALVGEHRKECPYGKCDTGCIVTMVGDAIALLEKAKQDRKLLDEYTKRTEENLHKICLNCKFMNDNFVCTNKSGMYYRKTVFVGGTCYSFDEKAVEQDEG